MIAGYTLLDWGHYVATGHKVSLWYLISGTTQQEQQSQQQQNQPQPSKVSASTPIINPVTGKPVYVKGG